MQRSSPRVQRKLKGPYRYNSSFEFSLYTSDAAPFYNLLHGTPVSWGVQKRLCSCGGIVCRLVVQNFLHAYEADERIKNGVTRDWATRREADRHTPWRSPLADPVPTDKRQKPYSPRVRKFRVSMVVRDYISRQMHDTVEEHLYTGHVFFLRVVTRGPLYLQ